MESEKWWKTCDRLTMIVLLGMQKFLLQELRHCKKDVVQAILEGKDVFVSQQLALGNH